MKLSFDINNILNQQQLKEEKIHTNTVKFDCKLMSYNSIKDLNENVIKTFTITSCILPKYDNIDFLKNTKINYSSVNEYIDDKLYQLEKKPLPQQQSISIVLIGVEQDMAKCISDDVNTLTNLLNDQIFLLNETVYVSNLKYPFYLNKPENKTNYILTENITKFQKLLMKLLENRNKVNIYTTKSLVEYVQNILSQIQ